MSGAMIDALKKKRMGDMGGGNSYSSGLIAGAQSQPQSDDSDAGGGMHGLVQSLSHEQKQELMQLLTKSVGGHGADASQIAKGAPSDQERSKIDAKMNDEPDDDPSADPDDETDEIGMSMLSSADKDQAGVERPARSLGDRVRMNMASKLKAKGKL